MSNSVKFSENGDVILYAKLASVECKSNMNYCTIEFSVKDQGIGIPIETQSHIFQPFYQADSSVNRRYGGSGN